MEALTQQSIEESINLSDMSVVLDAVLEGFIPGHGQIPWYSFDHLIIIDHHPWCIDKKGIVYSYPDDQLISGKYGTTQVISWPWNAYLDAQAFLFIEKLNKDIFLDENGHVLQEEFFIQIKNDPFPLLHYFARAKILCDSDPSCFA